MFVSKSISIDLEDLNEIQRRISEGTIKTVSEFVQKAIEHELKRDENEQRIKRPTKTGI